MPPVIYVTDMPGVPMLGLRSSGFSSYGGVQQKRRRDALCHAPVAGLRHLDAALGKGAAYLVTGSAAILSHAAESVIHVVAAGFAAFSRGLSTRAAIH